MKFDIKYGNEMKYKIFVQQKKIAKEMTTSRLHHRSSGLLSKFGSTGIRTYGRIFTLTAFYVEVTAGMPGYSVKLNIDGMLHINCYLRD